MPHARRDAVLGRRVSTAACACAVALLFGGACRSSTPPPASAPHEVRYALAWTLEGVTRAPNTSAWEVTNDLGYHVRVTQGWVTSYSIELVECTDARIGALLWPALEGAAWAGHSVGAPNPAAIRPMQVESLTDPRDREVGAVTLPPQAYCTLHYLLARAGRDAPGLPAELDMVDATLHVDGTYRAPGTATATAFTVHSASAYGKLFERAGDPPAAIRVDTGRSALRVEVRRQVRRLFDGVDFARMAERAIALQILRSLVEHAEVEMVPIDAHG